MHKKLIWPYLYCMPRVCYVIQYTHWYIVPSICVIWANLPQIFACIVYLLNVELVCDFNNVMTRPITSTLCARLHIAWCEQVSELVAHTRSWPEHVWIVCHSLVTIFCRVTSPKILIVSGYVESVLFCLKSSFGWGRWIMTSRTWACTQCRTFLHPSSFRFSGNKQISSLKRKTQC